MDKFELLRSNVKMDQLDVNECAELLRLLQYMLHDVPRKQEPIVRKYMTQLMELHEKLDKQYLLEKYLPFVFVKD